MAQDTLRETTIPQALAMLVVNPMTAFRVLRTGKLSNVGLAVAAVEEAEFDSFCRLLLFIDDTLIPHMSQEHKDIPLDAGLPSVLGGTAFPAYIAFHNYIMAVEMLLYRHAVIRLIKAFGRVLGENVSLFTQRGREILTRAEPLVERIIARIEKPQNRALD